MGTEAGTQPQRINAPTEPKTLTRDQISTRLAALPAHAQANAEARAEGQAGFSGGGRLFHGSVRPFLPGGPGGIRLRPVAGPRRGPLRTTVELAGLLALFVIGLIILKFAWVVWWYARGPQVATPDGLVKTFYSEVGVDGHMSIGRAWACLDPGAQAEFASLDDFETYWQTA